MSYNTSSDTCAPPPALGTMLCSREPPPARHAATPNEGCFQYETDYSGNVGNDMGMPTVGYRSGRFNMPEWQEGTYAKYYQSFADRDNAERIRNLSNDVIKETDALSKLTQEESVKRLGERLKDLHFWKNELEREINDITAETEDLVEMKHRLERGLMADDLALLIVTDNLNCRSTREGLDQCQDDVELNLLKELEVINNAQAILKRAIKETETQIKQNRSRKAELEQDWSDKHESDEIDTFNVELRNEHTHKQFHPGFVRFPEIQSTAESWSQCSHDNITRAEHERMASIQMRTLDDNILHDTSRDIKEQCDATENAFQRRIAEMEDTKAKLIENLKKTVDEIAATERCIGDLKKAIKSKENEVKVVQTRLFMREQRPNVDQCRDPVHYHLVAESNELMRTVDALQQKLNESNHALKDLQDQRLVTEKEIVIKTKSIFIDRDKCLSHRLRYPTVQRLLGYQ